MLNKIFEIVSAVRHRGIRFVWDYFYESVWFDLRYGTSTFQRVPKTEQVISISQGDGENGLLYVASFTSVTCKTVEHARKVLGPERAAIAQFVDLGCGKGKALLVYAQVFGQVCGPAAIGIEYDPVLADLARANVGKLFSDESTVHIITDSATNLRQHVKADVAIIYLYNSFKGDTLDATLNALMGLPHVLIYVDPAERSKLPARGYRILVENKGRYNADTWLVASSPDLAL